MREARVGLILWTLLLASACQPIGPVEREIRGLIEESGAEVAVAFRTLNEATELFIAPELVFHAASTMKIPVMFELFQQAEDGKLSLDDQVTVSNQFHSIVDGSPFSLQVEDDSDDEIYSAIGQPRTLGQLCEAMITVSSNLATNLLIEHLGVDRVQAHVDRLGAGGMRVLRGVEDGLAYRAGMSNTTTARGLFTLLDKLAHGEVVSHQASVTMIRTLMRQKFNEAIPAGLPSGTAVAHKTGQITQIHHDGGIVYTDNPFVLVVLVRGIEDDQVSAKLIADITGVLYRWSLEESSDG